MGDVRRGVYRGKQRRVDWILILSLFLSKTGIAKK
jgi:hypothetical protein